MRPATIALLASLLSVSASAQLSVPGSPASQRHPGLLTDQVATHVVARPDVETLMREDEQRNQWPLRYGAVVPLGLSSDEAGTWEELPGGELVWRLRLVAPGAYSLGLLLDRFEPAPGGELYVVSAGGATRLGAFTAAARQPNGMLALQPVLGSELVVEYVQPAAETARPELRLGEVVWDYLGILDRLVLEQPLALGGGGCLVDINCPQGQGYQDIKRSVLFVLVGGGFCSATLLNNTAEDQTPYFLTANHCGNMTNVVAVFGYENSGCSTADASQMLSLSGATLLAASNRYDSQLYRLSSTPPASFEPFYAGWDRATNPPGPGISISHPSGLPRKLARDNDAPVLNNTDFRATWELGKLEGGSSGSALFSGAKRVLGAACCVSDFDCRTQWAIYGRLGGFYDQKLLGQWLDPLGVDPTAIDGYDPFQGQAVVYDGSGANPVVYSSSPPTVGSVWTATIDTTAVPFPNVSTWIAGYRQPAAGFFVSQGELLVDLGSPLLFTSIAPSVANVSTHTSPIPANPALIGTRVYTQAVIVLGQPLTLTNGLELRLR